MGEVVQVNSRLLDHLIRTAEGKSLAELPAVPDQLKPTIDQQLERLERLLSCGCSRGKAQHFLQRLSVCFPRYFRELSEPETRALSESYIKHIQKLPEPFLDRVLEEVLRRCRYFPTIAEIVEAADEVLRPVIIKRNRLKLLKLKGG